MSARDYAKFGQLFSNGGSWNGEQIISKELIDETFQYVWDTPNWWTDEKGATHCIGGYQDILKNQRFSMLVEDLASTFLLIQRMILFLSE